ncbi:MAG: hypothetical protein KC419_10700 [Anaerolineales bacterium]|nr:hypothetical protein [Anaerolineales bacterium]
MATFSFFNLEQLTQNVHAALKAWHGISGNPENLLESLRLVQARRLALAGNGSPSHKRWATNEILLDGIDALEGHDQTGAQVLRLRFPENNKIMAVAHQLNVSEHTVSRLQKAAIDHLTAIIYDQEITLREQQAQELEAHLPPGEYTHLFGVNEAQTNLAAQLLETQAPWVVALVGIGGIGKTALADAVTRQVIREFVFDKVVWLRTEPQMINGRFLSSEHTYTTIIAELAQHLLPQTSLSPQQRLVQVRQILKERPHLIIIDNLETDAAHLFAHLSDLANPSKFLLTSRTRPTELAGTFKFSLDELSYADAADLIRCQARETGIHTLENATGNDITAIYNLTGGNPLALKLVVSLLDVLPLPYVLTALSKGQSGDIEALYKYIYRQAWQTITPEMRALLQAMPLVAESGATPDYLQQISGLPPEQLWPAIQELRRRSLLEVRGTIQEKRYGIHRLTETFLRTEIIRWPEAETAGD